MMIATRNDGCLLLRPVLALPDWENVIVYLDVFVRGLESAYWPVALARFSSRHKPLRAGVGSRLSSLSLSYVISII